MSKHSFTFEFKNHHMTTKQKSLFNKLCEIQKAYYTTYNRNIIISASFYNIVIFTDLKIFHQSFLNRLDNIFKDSKRIRYEIGISSNNELYIKIS